MILKKAFEKAEKIITNIKGYISHQLQKCPAVAASPPRRLGTGGVQRGSGFVSSHACSVLPGLASADIDTIELQV